MKTRINNIFFLIIGILLISYSHPTFAGPKFGETHSSDVKKTPTIKTKTPPQVDSQQNSQSNSQTTIQPNSQSNSQTNSQQNTRPNSQSNSQTITQPNSQSNSQTNSQQNTRPNSQSNSQTITQPNSQSNSQTITQPNSQSNSQTITQPNSQTNSQQNTRPNSQSNSQTNTQENSQLNSQTNTQQNSQSNSQINAQQNSQTITQPNLQRNSQTNTQPNIQRTAPRNATSCQMAKVEFKKLYMDLQAQYLNYAGQDTVVDAKGNITLVPHKSPTYEGKDFEEAIFKEYQNSLRKVGRLFQEATYGADREALKNSSKTLVDFLAAIESSDPSSYLINSDIEAVVENLAAASAKKFDGTRDDAFKLTANDKYLLKKLLTHAQDRICTVDHYNKNNGTGTKFFTAKQIVEFRNAPLNRMIGLIKKSQIKEDSDIKLLSGDELLVNGKVAVHSAIKEHMQRLSDWMKRNSDCKKALENPNFLQDQIQTCNYNRFLNSLDSPNFSELESILHFINANDKFINKREKKADTDLNEMHLEKMIDESFDNLGRKLSCTRLIGEGNKEKFFVSNIDYDASTSTFKKDQITCKVNGKELPAAQCHSNMKFVSDQVGRGLEVVNTNPKIKIEFGVKGVAACTGVGVVSDDGPLHSDSLTDPNSMKPPFSADYCKDLGETENPPRKLTPNKDGTECILDPNIDGTKPPFSAEFCAEEGKKKTPPLDLVPNKDGTECVPRDAIKPPFSAEFCAEEGKKKTPPLDLVPNKDGTECVLRDPTKPPFTDEMCKKIGEGKNPKEDLVAKKDGTACEPKTAEKKEDKKDGEALCREDNNNWIKNENNGTPAIKWEWDSKTNSCVDKRPAQEEAKDEAEVEGPNFGEPRPEKAPPARLVPLNIPSRGMYVLPGMP